MNGARSSLVYSNGTSEHYTYNTSQLANTPEELRVERGELKSIVGEKSFEFAVRIVKLYRYLCDEKREYVLSKQLLRSGTSIGANVREALHGQSKKDFLSKIGIALKEANEAQYWIELLYACEYLNEEHRNRMWADCEELICLLVSIAKTTKENIANKQR